MKRTILGLIAAAAIAVPTTTASAHRGPPAEVFTEQFAATITVPFLGPCPDSAPGLVTVDFRDVFHVTAFGDGEEGVVAFNQAGSFSFEPFDPSEPAGTGHYRQGNVSVEMQSGVFNSVFTAVGKFENGDQLRFQIHQTFVFANGELRVENFQIGCV